MTRFINNRYRELLVPALRVRFSDGHAEVEDPDTARRLAAFAASGVALAEGEHLPAGGEGAAERPAQSAPKTAHVAYAVAVVGLEAAAAEAMTKAELIEVADSATAQG